MAIHFTLSRCVQHPRRQSNPLRLEALEPRQLMAADIAQFLGQADANLADVDAQSVSTEALYARCGAEPTISASLNESAVDSDIGIVELGNVRLDALLPRDTDAAVGKITAENVDGQQGDTSLQVGVGEQDDSAIDAALGDLSMAGHAETIAASLSRVDPSRAEAEVLGLWGPDYEDVKKKEDFDVFKRKVYDDYSTFRQGKNSHDAACKKIGVDVDSDLADALKRVYENEISGEK